MANFVFNCSKGRGVEYYNRVKSNDPANSAFVIVLLATTGIESDATLKDLDTLTALVAGATNEATNTGYARKTLTDADLAALPSPDDTNDRFEVTFPNQTWTAVANDGTGAISKLVVCYDSDTTAGTDANIVPVSAHDFVVTPNGSDISTVVGANGFLRAAE
jgi:hypothetical protein